MKGANFRKTCNTRRLSDRALSPVGALCLFLTISEQASTLKRAHMRSPELREAAVDAMLQSPAPSAVPQWAMPFSTQLHHKIFSLRVSVVSQPSPSSLLTGAWLTE